jgi:hypothetical protein
MSMEQNTEIQSLKSQGPAILIMILGVPFYSLWQGFVLSKLWSWFVVTTFDGVPSLSTTAAAGIMLILTFLNTMKYTAKVGSNSAIDDLGRIIVMAIIVLPYALGVGYFLKCAGNW